MSVYNLNFSSFYKNLELCILFYLWPNIITFGTEKGDFGRCRENDFEFKFDIQYAIHIRI